MKKVFPIFILSLAASFFAFQCEDQQPREIADCIDPSKINENAACYMLYDPVCGCDGKTYGNDCEAINSGVTSFKKGACN